MAGMARRRGYGCVDAAATIDRNGFRPLFGRGRRQKGGGGYRYVVCDFVRGGAIRLLGWAFRRSDIW